MGNKLKDLVVDRFLTEFKFVDLDHQYKLQMIEENRDEFLRLINEKIERPEPQSDNKSSENTQQKKENKTYFVNENQKSRIKKLFREIAKKTHPDKVDSEELKEFYIRGLKAYDENDIICLYLIAKELKIWFEIPLEDMPLFSKIIDEKRDEIKKLESSFIWFWIVAKTEKEKNEVVDNFLNKHRNNL